MSAATLIIQEAKSKLRLQIKNKLKDLTVEDKVKQTFVVARELINDSDFQKAKRIAVYVSMKNEIGTYDILKSALTTNKQVYIPLVVGENMQMVRLKSFDEIKTMPKTKWGIMQPLESENRENCLSTGGVDFVVVPGMAFTTKGLRLGHGKGYYDRFLAQNLRIRGSTFMTVGLSFNEQILEELPTTEKDFTLSQVIFPRCCMDQKTPLTLSSPPEPFLI